MEFSAKHMIDLIEDLFDGRETVNKYDVVQRAKFYPLGADGEKVIGMLPAKRYTKDQLNDVLAHLLIEGGGTKR